MRTVFILVSTISLSACAPQVTEGYWQDGAAVSRIDQSFTQCQVEALRDVPQSVAVGTQPSYTTPVQTNCYNTGYSAQCSSTGGQIIGGQTYSYDPNAGLRNRVEAQCMANRGFSLVSLLVCTATQRNSGALRGFSGNLPPLQTVACISNGAYLPL